MRESENLMEEAHAVVKDAVMHCLDRRISDWGKIKNVIRDSLSDYIWKKMKRNPLIHADHHGGLSSGLFTGRLSERRRI